MDLHRAALFTLCFISRFQVDLFPIFAYRICFPDVSGGFDVKLWTILDVMDVLLNDMYTSKAVARLETVDRTCRYTLGYYCESAKIGLSINAIYIWSTRPWTLGYEN